MVVDVFRWTLGVLAITLVFACPENEQQAECVNTCKPCDTGQCPLICTPGCNCIPGYARNFNNVCVPKELCLASSSAEPVEKDEDDEEESGGCPVLFRCIQSCRRRGFRTGFCAGRNRRSCRCRGASQDSEISSPDNFGCPNVNLCSRHCRYRGYRFGRCVGFLSRTCRCIGPWSTTDDPQDTGGLPAVDSGGCPSRRICRNVCRRRGFRTGVCTGIGRRTCRCFGRIRDVDELNEEDGISETDDSGGCPLRFLCIRNCRSRGFRTGICIGRRGRFCRCLGRTSNDEVPAEVEGGVEEEDSGGCPLVVLCVRSCRRRGFRTGICIGPRGRFCRCLGRTSNDEVPAEVEGDVEEEDSGGCPILPLCVLSCRRRGFTFGVCLGRFCQCFRRRGNDEEVPAEVEEEDARGCPRNLLCARSCRRRGFRTGHCVGRRHLDCKCVGRRFSNDEVPAEIEGDVEEEDSGGCPILPLCVLSCRRRGFTFGICLGRFCQCFRRRGNDEDLPVEPTDDGSTAYDEDEGVSRCPNPIVCTNYCKNSGYDNGVCRGPDRKSCVCYDGNPPSPETDDPKSGGCPDAFRCIRSCKRQGFHSGRCFKGICRCYGEGI